MTPFDRYPQGGRALLGSPKGDVARRGYGDYLADARAKLQALATLAERFGDHFVRVESVAKVDDGSLRVLNLTDPNVRAAVLGFEGAKVSALYQSEQSRPYS